MMRKWQNAKTINVGVDTESAKLRVAGEKKSVKERIERLRRKAGHQMLSLEAGGNALGRRGDRRGDLSHART